MRGGDGMKTVDICLNQLGHVSTLVNITNQYPYPILLRQGRFLVDAKSVLGICSLQRSEPLQMEIYSDDCHALMDQLKPLMS